MRKPDEWDALYQRMSPDGQYIMEVLLVEWANMFMIKNLSYGADANRLGVKGAFVDIHRKEGKLKRAIWDGQELEGEQPREILMDLIGHCFLTICAIDTAQSREDHDEPLPTREVIMEMGVQSLKLYHPSLYEEIKDELED